MEHVDRSRVGYTKEFEEAYNRIKKRIEGDGINESDLACPCCGQANMTAEFIKKFSKLLEEVPNLEISSGYRCLKYNKSKGWSETSPHVKGCAVDLHEVSARKKRFIVDTASRLGFLGIGVYNGHIHVDTDPRWHGEPIIWSGTSQ